MLTRVRNEYFAWGWLLIAWLPLLQIIGRGVFNIVGAAALLWAAIALSGRRIVIDRALLSLYAILVLTFLLSVAVAGDRSVAWHHWYEYFLYTLFCLFTLATLQHVNAGLSRFLRALGWSGLTMVVILYAWLVVQVQQPGFSPERIMREDNLPLLAPFMLYTIQHVFRLKHWRWISLLVLLPVFGYVVGSEGRAALVGLCIGLLAYSRLVSGIRLRNTIPIALAGIVIAMFLHQGQFRLGASEGGTFAHTLDKLSTYRTAIWRHALANPPENIWLGTGMGNVRDHPEILTIRLADNTKIQVGKHLHNFVLDCWYATGMLGLAALLAWLGFLIWRSLRTWRQATNLLRAQVGTLIAAGFAILGNAFLSYSYGSKQFGVYLFTFLVVAAYARRGDSLPVNEAQGPPHT